MTTPHNSDRAEQSRNSQIGAIHAGKRDLKLTDDEYRVLLLRITKKSSTRDMTPAERGLVLDEMRRMAFPGQYVMVDQRLPGAPQIEKIYALARELERTGAIRTGESREVWVTTFARNQVGVDNLRWLDVHQANQVIEGLKGWLKKEQEKTRPPDPTTASTKAATFDAMKLVAGAPAPVDYIRRLLSVLAAQTFATPEIRNAVDGLIAEFAVRARASLDRWDYGQARNEVLRLIEQVMELEPEIGERLMAAITPTTDEIATSVRRNKRKGHPTGGSNGKTKSA